jgi:hypothetical protein
MTPEGAGPTVPSRWIDGTGNDFRTTREQLPVSCRTFPLKPFPFRSNRNGGSRFLVEKAAADAKKGGPARIIFNLEKGATYRIKRPLAFLQLNGFEFNGNGAQLINTARGSTLQISAPSHITVRDLTIDYDPLPFTQGTITAFDKAALQITVKVDPGYPDDPPLLASITDGFFKVMDRHTRALKAGARDFLTPVKVERISQGLIRVHLRWSANDLFPSQLPIAVGDVVAISNGSAHAIIVDGSDATSFTGVKLFASPGMGLLENGGAGAMMLQKVSIIPGPRPNGAATDRLVSTNSDGSHFITVERGPTMEDCSFANTSDDAVNVHGFYYYVVEKAGPGAICSARNGTSASRQVTRSKAAITQPSIRSGGPGSRSSASAMRRNSGPRSRRSGRTRARAPSRT